MFAKCLMITTHEGPSYPVPCLTITWEGFNGQIIDKTYKAPFHDRAEFRKDLILFRGHDLTPNELANGIDLQSLITKPPISPDTQTAWL